MASQKLSALTALGTAFASNDLLYVDDISAGAAGSKSVTLADIFTTLEQTTSDGALIIGGVAAPAVSAAGKAKVYFDSTSNVLNLSQNGAAFIPFTLGGGQTGRLTYWLDAKTVTTFAELQRTSDGALQFNAIAAPAVSAAAKATLYFDTADNQLKLSRNGGAYASLIAGVSTIDSAAKSANGASISGNALIMQTADATAPGVVSTTTQTFAGTKTFNGQIIANRATSAGSTQVALTISAPSGGLVTTYAALGSATGTGGYISTSYDATTGYITHGFWNNGDWLIFKSDPTYPYTQIKNDGGGTRDIVLGSDGTFGASATIGFVWLPAVNGAPSGVPAGLAQFGYGNTCPTVIDKTNNLWYGYINGAWRNLTGVYPSSVMNLNSIAVASGSASVTTYTAFTYQQASSGNLSVTAANATHTAALFQGAASQSAAIFAIRQNATPGTGAFFDCQTSAPTSLFTVDSVGQISKLRGVGYAWPSAQGAASTVLTNDGSGNLSWAAGGGGSPGGSNKQVQFNNSSAFGGAAGFEYQSGASPNVSITAQNATHIPLTVIGAASNSAAVLVAKSGSSGTGDLFQAQSSSGTVLFSVSSAGAPSSPGAGSNSERYGSGATAPATSSIAIGPNSTTADSGAGGSGNIAIGAPAKIYTGSIRSIIIGRISTNGVLSQVTAVGDETVGISGLSNIATVGWHNSPGFSNTTLIGTDVSATAQNQFVAGSNTAAMNDVFFGKGVVNATPSAYTINGTGGSGTDIAGAGLQLAGGKGTGNAAGGVINLQTSDAGSSGTTLQALTTKLSLNSSNLILTSAGQYQFGSSGITSPDAGLARNRAGWISLTNGSTGAGSLTVPDVSGTDQAGLALTLGGGRGTGAASSGSIRLQTSVPGSTGPTVHTTLVDRIVVNGQKKALTKGSAVSLFDLDLPAGAGAAMQVKVTIVASDGADYQVYNATIFLSAVNKGGTYTKDVQPIYEQFANSTGTIGATWSLLNGTNKITLQVNANPSLTPTTLYAYYTIENNSQQAITIL